MVLIKCLPKNTTISSLKNGTEYKKIISNNKVFEGVFHENGNLKEGTLIFETSSRFKKYVGSLDKNGFFIKGTSYFKNGDKYSGTYQNKNNKTGKR